MWGKKGNYEEYIIIPFKVTYVYTPGPLACVWRQKSAEGQTQAAKDGDVELNFTCSVLFDF